MPTLMIAGDVFHGEVDGYHVHVPNRFMEEGITLFIQCVYMSAYVGPDEEFEKVPVAQSSGCL